MTKQNVGSLLVFDGNQVTCDSPSSASACVGIITERGTGSLGCFNGGRTSWQHCRSAEQVSPRVASLTSGLSTAADYLTKVVVQGKNSHCTKVAEIMTPAQKLRILTPHHTVLEAMEVMVQNNVRHIPVVSKTPTSPA